MKGYSDEGSTDVHIMRVIQALSATFWIAIGALGLIWWMGGPSSDEYVFYSAVCENRGLDDFKIMPVDKRMRNGLNRYQAEESYERDVRECEIKTTGRYVYRMNLSLGEIYAKGDGYFGYTQKAVNCSIFDNENFSCEFDGQSDELFVVKNGLIAHHRDHPDFLYQSFRLYRWQYWIARIHRFFGLGNIKLDILIPDQPEYF